MVDKNKTLKTLREHWRYAINFGYNEDKFLGIFSKEKISTIFIIPSLENLCFDDLIYLKLSYNANTNIIIKDIRYLIIEKNIFDEYILNSKYEKIFNTYFNDINNTETLRKGIIEILKYSFIENESQIISKKDFLKKLTNAETKAYYSIVKEIGEEGNITISKLVEKNSISRPVYNNLITKMKENNVASVVNMGMKGTYIKILEAELKAEAIDFK